MRHVSLVSMIALLAAGCSGKVDSTSTTTSSTSTPPVAPAAAEFVAPPPPAIAPQIPDVRSLDRDGDRVDDHFATIPEDDAADGRVNVEAIFDAPITSRELETFVVRGGGVLRYVFRHVSYGFIGRLPRSEVKRVAALYKDDAQRSQRSHLLILKADRFFELHMDEATKTGRVRPVFANGFAGRATGFNGSPTINIAILDSGVDVSHPDLAGNMIGWKDYTSQAFLTPTDLKGHGTHVAGIALGTGQAFGVGPGTLLYTEYGDISALNANEFPRQPLHFASTFTITSTATWIGGGTASLGVFRNPDGSTGLYSVGSGPTSGASPLTHVWGAGVSAADTHWCAGLVQNAGKTVGQYAVKNSVTNYPAAGDGLPALRGVAPLSKWFGAKVFPAVGQASTADVSTAIDNIVAQSVALNIKIANASFSTPNGGADLVERAKVNTMVANGIVFVASNGNAGSSVGTGDPSRAANAITVGATNEINQLTEYTSLGSSVTGADDDNKPDVLAPGGSDYYSRILSVDSNTAENDNAGFADVQANDYTSISGTSMAAPFVAGSAALVIQALEDVGTAWSYSSTASPFLVKTLLLASATETNANREVGVGHPVVGRSLSPKDQYEGYGLINPDAAIEAVKLGLDLTTPFTGTTTGGPRDRRAWGWHLTVPAGRTLQLALTTPATADYDIYLYSPTPGDKGNPVIITAADLAGLGTSESISYTPSVTTTPYVFVKRISGSGSFTLVGSICGDGKVSAPEDCDNSVADECCSAACAKTPDGTPCGDGAGDAGVDDAGDAGDSGDAGDASSSSTSPPSGKKCQAGVCTLPVVDAGSDSSTSTSNLPRDAQTIDVDEGIGISPGEDDSGCGCKVASLPRSSPPPASVAGALVALGMLVARRRRK